MADTEKRVVVTEYRADTSDFSRGHQKMRDEIEETQGGFVSWAKNFNESINSGMEWLGKFNQAFEGTQKIIEFAVESTKAYAENTRLMAAAGSVDIERLRKAAGGLRTETELLSFAAKTQHGVIRAGSDDMETAEKAMRMLTRAGFDQAEVSKKIEDAMVSLKVNGLDDLGITVKKGSTDLETFNNLMDALAVKAQGADTATESTSEKVQRMGVDFHDAFEKMRIAIGQVVVAMLPLVEAAAKLTKDVGDFIKNHPNVIKGGGGGFFDLTNATGGLSSGGLPSLGDLSAFGDFLGDLAPGLGSPTGSTRRIDPGLAAFGTGFNAGRAGQTHVVDVLNRALGAGSVLFGKAMSSEEFRSALKEAIDKAKADYKAAQDAAKQLAEEQKKLADKVAKDATDALVKKLEAEQNAHAHSANETSFEGGLKKQRGFYSQLSQQLQGGSNDQRYAAFAEQKQASFLESAFGKPEEFQVYQELFASLSGAVGGTYEAIVRGSEPAAHAFKKLIAEGLLATGKSEAIQALKEEAWALGELAIGNFAGFTLHQTSAAKHAAVAVIAGVAASSLGVGGAASPSGSGGSAGSGSGASAGFGDARDHRVGAPSGPNDGRPVILAIYGDSFADDSPRMRQANAEKAFERVYGSGQGVSNR